MHSTRKNGDNPLADVISQRREMLQAIRSTPRPFDLDFEVKPEPRATAAVFRSAHHARSTPVDPGTMSWHELHSPLPEESAAYLAALLGDDVVTADHGGAGSYSTILCDGLHVAGATQTEHGRDPSWNTFVRVPSVDLICHIALSKGGSVRVQPSGILGLHVAVLTLPSRERRLADTQRLDDLGHGTARREHGVGLPQFGDDLFGCMSGSLHRESPGRHRRPPGLT